MRNICTSLGRPGAGILPGAAKVYPRILGLLGGKVLLSAQTHSAAASTQQGLVPRFFRL